MKLFGNRRRAAHTKKSALPRGTRTALIAAVINVFVFFGPQFVEWVKSLYRRWKWKQNFKK